MVVVLAVITVAVSATALALGPRHGSAAGAAAAELAVTIQTATDRSIATGAREILMVDRSSYVAGGVLHALPEGVVLRGAPGHAVPIALDAPPFVLAVTGNGERWHVAFDGLRAAAARDRT